MTTKLSPKRKAKVLSDAGKRGAAKRWGAERALRSADLAELDAAKLATIGDRIAERPAASLGFEDATTRDRLRSYGRFRAKAEAVDVLVRAALVNGEERRAERLIKMEKYLCAEARAELECAREHAESSRKNKEQTLEVQSDKAEWET